MALPQKKYPDLGKWMTYEQSIYSAKGTANGIDNTPTDAQYARMQLTYKYIYAPLCEHFGVRLPVNSFFRCPKLNKLVKGSKTSEHMDGGAIDIDCKRFSNPLTNNELFEYVRLHMAFDQLIFEAPDEANVPQWVHIAYRPQLVAGGNRNHVMLGQRDEQGDMYYQNWPWSGGSSVAATIVVALLVGLGMYVLTGRTA